MPDPSKGLLLGILDRQLEDRINFEEWERMLVHSVLFQPTLKALDVFFFMSKHLEKHLLDLPGKSTIFTEALKAGIIEPAFRTKERQEWTFNDALKQLVRNNAIGLIELQKAESIAKIFDAKWKYKAEGHENARYFSTKAATNFRTLGEEMIEFECPPSLAANGELAEAWGKSKELRKNVFGLACESANKRDKPTEVTRADLQFEIAKHFGVFEKNKYEDSSRLVCAVPKDDQARVRLLLDGFHGIYNLSVASDLGTASGLPAWRNTDGIAADTLLALNSKIVNTSLPSASKETITVVLEIPPLDTISRFDAATLVNIALVHGDEYRGLVAELQQGHKAVDEKALQSAASSYAKALRDGMKYSGNLTRLEYYCTKVTKNILPAIVPNLFMAVFKGGIPSNWIGSEEAKIAATIGGAVWSIYQYLDTAPVYTEHQFDVPKEISLPSIISQGDKQG